MNIEELIQVYNFLMQVEAKGDSVVYLAESIVRIRRILQEPTEEQEEPCIP